MSQEKGLVSILMNCYNGEAYLKEAIDSVYAQTYKNWEIIFWNNCSTDRSLEIAQSYDSKIKIYNGTTNVLLYEARALAMEKVSGEFIAILDTDDLWLPQRLEKQVALFVDPSVGMTFSDVIFFNQQYDISRLYEKRKYYEGKCFRELLGNYFISLATITLRKSALDTLDEIFDPRFQMIGDADLVRRLSLSWNLKCVPEVLARVRIHDMSLTSRHQDKFASEALLLLDKYEKMIPNFYQEYAHEIYSTKVESAINLFKHDWRNGRGGQSRKHLTTYLNKPKPIAYYMLSFLPYKVFQTVFRRN